MQNHHETSVYASCKHDIETAFANIFPPSFPGKSDPSVQLSLAWLYGGLDTVFVWDNAAIGIDRDECGYYIGRLQNTIAALTLLSQNALEPECRGAYFNAANTLQNALNCLTTLNPKP